MWSRTPSHGCVLGFLACLLLAFGLGPPAGAQDIDFYCGTRIPGHVPIGPGPEPWDVALNSSIIAVLQPQAVPKNQLDVLARQLSVESVSVGDSQFSLKPIGSMQLNALNLAAQFNPSPTGAPTGGLIGLLHTYKAPTDVFGQQIGVDVYSGTPGAAGFASPAIPQSAYAVIGFEDQLLHWWWLVDLPPDPFGDYSRYQAVATFAKQANWTGIGDRATDFKHITTVVTGFVGMVNPNRVNVSESFVADALALPGDANGDGSVSFRDLLILAQHYGQKGGWTEGNFAGSPTIGFDSLLILAQHYGQPMPPVGAVGAVPEPLAAAPLLAFAGLLRRRRR